MRIHRRPRSPEPTRRRRRLGSALPSASVAALLSTAALAVLVGLLSPTPAAAGTAHVADENRDEFPVVSVAVTAPDGTLDITALPMPDVATARATADALGALPNVVAADTATPVHALGDPLRSQQWALDRWSYLQATAVSTPAARSTIVVAVTDTGVQASHPDFAPGTVLSGRSFVTAQSPDGRIDGHGHGTHVAGTIAAATDNGVGVTAAAAGVKILPVKVLTDSGGGTDYTVAQGVTWAVDNGATVVNLSLGGTGTSSVMASAVQYAQSRGVTVVAAAGNNAAVGSPVSYPAGYPSVIAVGAVDRYDKRSSFSNIGDYVDVAAPGSGILSTVLNDSYASWSGTSMATPHVSAVAALARAAAPTATVDQVRAAIESTALDVGATGTDAEFGAGIVRPLDAVNAAIVAANPSTQPPPTAPPTTDPPPSGDTTPVPPSGLSWRMSDFDGSGVAGAARSGGDVADAAVTIEYARVPHVFYADRTSGSLRHAWLTGGIWAFENLDGTGRLIVQGSASATGIAAGVYFGAPHVFYRDVSTDRLRHGWWTGRAWAFEDLDGPGAAGGNGRSADTVGGDVAVVGLSGLPHVFYADTDMGDLRHAWYDATNGRWLFETLDGAGGSGGKVDADIAQDVAAHGWGGSVHVYFRSESSGRLRHAWWDVSGVRWRFEDLDGAGTGQANGRLDATVGFDPTVVTYGSAPHVLYRSAASPATMLRHAWWTGSQWRFESVGTTSVCADCQPGVGITAATTGVALHVWHYDDGRLRHTYWTGTQWASVTLDGEGAGTADGRRGEPLGQYPSAIVSQGRTYVFHADPTTGRMRLATGTPTP